MVREDLAALLASVSPEQILRNSDGPLCYLDGDRLRLLRAPGLLVILNELADFEGSKGPRRNNFPVSDLRRDEVVPVRHFIVGLDGKRLHLGIGDPNALDVRPTVEVCFHAQAP